MMLPVVATHGDSASRPCQHRQGLASAMTAPPLTSQLALMTALARFQVVRQWQVADHAVTDRDLPDIAVQPQSSPVVLLIVNFNLEADDGKPLCVLRASGLPKPPLHPDPHFTESGNVQSVTPNLDAFGNRHAAPEMPALEPGKP